MYEPKPNSGSLWAIPKRRTSKKGNEYDSYTGGAFIECPHCKKTTALWLNALLKETKAGKVFDILFKPKEEPNKEVPIDNIF